MPEHVFPPSHDGVPARLLPAAILHHLLVRHPRGVAAGDLSRALMGPGAGPRQTARLVAAVAGLCRDGLVATDGPLLRATAAAVRFHRIMLGGDA